MIIERSEQVIQEIRKVFIGKDEIKRISPKTQAALLEVMEEGSVTVDGVTHVLPKPFICIATQNHYGTVGTQALPESQLDRFMIRLSIGYPERDSQVQILIWGASTGNCQVSWII